MADGGFSVTNLGKLSVSCFQDVHKLENHQEEAKKPFENNDNVETKPFNKYSEVESFSEAQSLILSNTKEGVEESNPKPRENQKSQSETIVSKALGTWHEEYGTKDLKNDKKTTGRSS